MNICLAQRARALIIMIIIIIIIITMIIMSAQSETFLFFVVGKTIHTTGLLRPL